MGKTQRILSYLPPTFQPARQKSPLFSVVDAVGQRLLETDNLLVEVMRAHWVDFADEGADAIRDLGHMAALFALQPRPDEDVETFRKHLKSYIRTYLEGSATLPGVLRLAASTLALSLEDELEPGPNDPPYLLDVLHPGDDATFKLFGFKDAEASGLAPAPAHVVGRRDLSSGVDLSSGSTLVLALDGDIVASVDAAGDDPTATTLWEIARAINEGIDPELGLRVASHDSKTLVLTSPAAGPEAEIQIGNPNGDAADALLGAAPRFYQGNDAQPALVRGSIDHAPSGGVPLVDLSQDRYLRLAVDGGIVHEIDCSGADAAATTLDEVAAAINEVLGAEVANHDEHVLTLTSPTAGVGSRLDLFPAPAHDARHRLFGPAVRTQARGASEQRARLVGRADLSVGVDLSVRRLLRLGIDGGEPQEIDCAAIDPTATQLADIVQRINTTLGATVAAHDGRRLILTSPTSGAGGSIDVAAPEDPAADATDLLLGIVPRVYTGTPPGPAMIRGQIAPEEPLDLRIQRHLWLAIDGGETLLIDCAGADPARTTLQEIVDAVNEAAGTTIAFHQEGQLILQSPTAGATSSLVLRAPEIMTRRYFYTRGRVWEEAATSIFGFAAGSAAGRLPEPARLTGSVDLSRGADLRVNHTLQLQIDDREPVEINVANPARPLVTLLSQTKDQPPHWNIVDAINTALDAHVASERNGNLVLTSPTEGPQGRIALGVSIASDAGQVLFGLPPDSANLGRAAEQVRFVGLSDLARGLDVSETYMLRVGIDERPPTEIDLRTAVPANSPSILSPREIVEALNRVLGKDYASHDVRRVILTSRRSGSASKITIEPVGEHDATPLVFGLSEARSYTGRDGTAARLRGQVDLSPNVDLQVRRHLSLEIDGQLIADIDCAGAASATTTLAEIISRINAAAKQTVAGEQEGMLFIISPTTGAGSSVTLKQSTKADARQRLLGDTPSVVLGQPGQAAVLVGTTKLSRPIDLSQRAMIQLRVDNGEVREITCSGENPARTFPDEVVNAINAVFPGLATLDAEWHLVLSAALRIELLALRHFTVFEFSPVETRTEPQPVQFRTTWSVTNASVRDEPVEWVLYSLRGVDRPRLTRRDTRGWVRVNAVVPAEWTLHVRLLDDGQLQAWMDTPDGQHRDLTDVLDVYPSPDVLRLPIGESQWRYSDCFGARFNSAFFGSRPSRGRPRKLDVVPGHFAGGEVCQSPGIFNQSRFYDPDQPGTETVFGTQAELDHPVALSTFWYRTHQAGCFELQLPTDLPPQFGGRFNTARFTGPGVTYTAAIFDLPEDPQALDEQVKARPGMVTAHVTLIPDRLPAPNGVPLFDDIPVYDVPFKDDRPLVGGSKDQYARLYLRQPGVLGGVELRATDVGEWGNAITVSAPDSDVPGAFDVTVTYTGQDVFENARPKVAEQLAYARAAGVLAEVTRR